MVARGNATLSLSERVEAEHHESEARHVDAEGLKIRAGLAVRPPVSVVEQHGRGGPIQLVRQVEMGGNPGSGEGLKDDLVDAVSLAWNYAGDFRLQVGRPRQAPEAEGF